MGFYKAHVFCCNNERPAGHARGCCREKGADALRNHMRVRVKDAGLEGVRVNVAGCMDRCEQGPVFVVYPEGVWYSAKTQADIDAIVDEHLKGGRIVERLRLPDTQDKG